MQNYRTGFISLLLVVLLAACNFNSPGELTPTVQDIAPTETIEPTLTLTPSLTATAQSLVQVEEPTETATLAPPTLTFTPTDTPGPYEHTIQTRPPSLWPGRGRRRGVFRCTPAHGPR